MVRAGVISIEQPGQRKAELEAQGNGAAEHHDAPERPFPILAEEALYGPIGDLIRAIEPETEADPAGILVQFLVAFGNACGRQAYMRVGATRHHANLFACVVGKSSKSRNGTGLDVVRAVFERLDPDWKQERIITGLSSSEGVISAVRGPIHKIERKKEKGKYTGETEEVLVDAGVKDKRLFVAETEFSGALRVMGRDSNTLSAVLRNAWDPGDLSTLTKHDPTRASGAHVSIIGHIVEEELAKELAECEFFNGFANRFLWVCVQRARLLAEGGNIELGTLEFLLKGLRGALSRHSEPFELRRSPDAKQLWKKLYEEELSRAGYGLVGAVTDRGEAQVLRLSLIYALADESSCIEVPHLEAALAVWRYCKASAYRLFGHRSADPKAQKILEALKGAPDGLTGTEISARVFNHNEKAEVISGALQRLRDAGLADPRTQNTAGWPSERWFFKNNGHE